MNDADLIRLVDSLEDQSEGYLALDDVLAAARDDVSASVERGLLLVDYRTGTDGSPVTVCRLNRRHPLVVELTRW